MKVHMRSVDVFLGLPFNIASYAALLQYVALICQYDVGRLIMDLGDTHIYLNHINQCQELLQRNPDKYPLPRLEILPPYTLEIGCVHPHQFVLVGYESYPAIKAPIAV
jgi:thymidylate synthase